MQDNSFLTYTMYGIMQGLWDFHPTSLYFIPGIIFVFHIFFFKNGLITEPWMMQFKTDNEPWMRDFKTDNDQLKEKISTLEKDTTNLMDQTQSMVEGEETLSERIHAVECIKQNLLNSYDRLMDRVSVHRG